MLNEEQREQALAEIGTSASVILELLAKSYYQTPEEDGDRYCQAYEDFATLLGISPVIADSFPNAHRVEWLRRRQSCPTCGADCSYCQYEP